MRLTDRRDAGRRLAQRLLTMSITDPVILALPRGGVPVGFEIARALSAPLDLILVRKIGAPDQEEFAIGAIADGAEPELVTDARLIAALGVQPAYLDCMRAAGLQEIERRRRVYLGNHPPADVERRTVIIVDDGIATGATMLAALRGTRRRKPARIVLAVPVAPRGMLERLRKEVDEVVYLKAPVDFRAVGDFYNRFPQLQDDDVIALLDQARAFMARDKYA